MLTKLRTRANSESGFTLVELLVVMLILGLLAAIAIPAFFNQRDKARDADAKAGARTAQTAMETAATDRNGTYTGVTDADLVTIEETLSEYNAVGDDDLGVAVSGDTYSVTVRSDGGDGNLFRISRAANGGISYDCGTTGSLTGNASEDLGGDGKAGCPSGGNWAG